MSQSLSQPRDFFFYLIANWRRRRDDRLVIVLSSERHFQETAKRRNQRLTQSPRAWCCSLRPHLLLFFVLMSRLSLGGHHSSGLHTKQPVSLLLLLLIPRENALHLAALGAGFTNRRLIPTRFSSSDVMRSPACLWRVYFSRWRTEISSSLIYINGS